MPPRTRRKGGRVQEVDQGEVIMYFVHTIMSSFISKIKSVTLFSLSLAQGDIEDHGGVGRGRIQGGGLVDPGKVIIQTRL